MARSIVRTLLVSGAAAGLMASAGACSCSIGSSSHAVSKSDVASQITQKLTDAQGNKPDSVDCPNDLPATMGAQLNCSMKVKGATYAVNVTVTNTSAASHLTVYPRDAIQPDSSDLNWIAGGTVCNLTLARLGADGRITLANGFGTADAIIDVVGWFN